MLPHSSTKVLLVGRELLASEQMMDTLRMVGASLAYAGDVFEARRLLAREQPDLIILALEPSETVGLEFCSEIRSRPSLANVPILVAGGSGGGFQNAFEALSTGADDIIGEHFDPDRFLAKLVWNCEQRILENQRKLEFDVLRRRQMQTLEIVKETSNLFRSLAAEGASPSVEKDATFDQRVEIGLRMVNGLASVLEDQLDTIDGWFVSPRRQMSKAASYGTVGFQHSRAFPTTV